MDNMNAKESEVFRIKKSRNLTPLLALLAFLMACASVYLLYIYFTLDLRQPFETLFLVVGGVSAVYFTVCFFNLLYQSISPKNALLISEDGFLDLVNGGCGVGFVSWANVSRLEMAGGDKPYIGIGLLASENVTENAPQKLVSLIESRTENGQAELMIRPFDISCSLEEAYSALRDFRNRYYRNIESGDTNIIDTVDKTRAIKLPDTVNEFDNIFKEKEIPEAEKENPNVKTGDLSVDDTDATQESKKTIDEILNELSSSVKKESPQSEKRQSKLTQEDIDELIRLLKDKK